MLIRTALSLSFVLFSFQFAMSQSVSCSDSSPQEFRIDLQRLGQDTVEDHGLKVLRIYGDVAVNHANVGRFYENPSRKIPAGIYKGVLRYRSDHAFVQSSCGQMARDGDFLLEVSDVKTESGAARTNILFHPGRLPSNSDGCILFGARQFDIHGNPLPLNPESPLARIRHEFYGTDNPISCPNKRIIISIQEF